MTTMRRHDLLAAIDVGSNSFHLLVTRPRGATLDTVEHLCDSVRLAAGINAAGQLDNAHYDHALATLRSFATHIADIPAHRVQAVATHAVRTLRPIDTFLGPASAALGQPIRVISGEEEARLIWVGVVSTLPPSDDNRLVVDIGGGSTEFIVGRGLDLDIVRSAAMGCVTAGMHFFADGELNAARWQRAQEQLRQPLETFAKSFREHGWEHAYGTSGTARAIGSVLATSGQDNATITASALTELRDRLLRLGHIERLVDLPLAPHYRPVFAGGVAVMQAAFETLGIQRMRVCNAAMREGILWDMHHRTAAAATGQAR